MTSDRRDLHVPAGPLGVGQVLDHLGHFVSREVVYTTWISSHPGHLVVDQLEEYEHIIGDVELPGSDYDLACPMFETAKRSSVPCRLYSWVTLLTRPT